MTPDVTNLATYLNAPRTTSTGVRWDLLAGAAVLALAGLVVWSVAGRGSGFFFVLLVFGVGAVSKTIEAVRTHFAALERRRFGFTEVHAETESLMREFVDDGSLAERLHPAVAEALDGCAAHAMAIRSTLAEPHRMADIRMETLRAVEEEMQDALLQARAWLRPKGGKRKTFSERVAADPDPATARSLRSRGEKLGRLREDLSSALGEPKRGVERVLEDIREIKVAERELRDRP